MRQVRKHRSSARSNSKRPAVQVTPSREVIHGIALQVSGRELGVRLAERMRWHRGRADALIQQLKKLEDAETALAGDVDDGLGRFQSPRPALEKKLRDHRERATFLGFLRDHINDHDIYRLDTADLRMTEILPERHY
jgi:hypothetical protein